MLDRLRIGRCPDAALARLAPPWNGFGKKMSLGQMAGDHLGLALRHVRKCFPQDRGDTAVQHTSPAMQQAGIGGVLHQRVAEDIADQTAAAASHQKFRLHQTLQSLLEANTDLTKQDKDMTEQVAALTREIHGLLTKRG